MTAASCAAQLIVFNDGIKGTRTGLILPDDLTESKWEEVGSKLGDVATAYQWMVGDWWIFGEKKYGNRKHIVNSPTWTGPAFETCMNCGRVCRAFETSLRREVLTFKHHTEASALKITNPKLAEEILDWCELGRCVHPAAHALSAIASAAHSAIGEWLISSTQNHTTQ
jgi:hypothetical protein